MVDSHNSFGVKHYLVKAKLGTRRGLAFTRYCFVRDLCPRVKTIICKHPPCLGTPPHHRPHYCAIYCFLPTILYCNTCCTILAMTISCKGQGEGAGREPSRVQLEQEGVESGEYALLGFNKTRVRIPWGTQARGASRSRRAVWVIVPSPSLR